MAIFSSLKTLIRNPSSRCRQAFLSPSSSSSFLPASASAASSPSISLPPAFLFFSPYRSTKSLVPPFSHWVVTGPLFLSSPPWKLSQAATPLLLRNVEALTLARFPATLGLAPSPCSPPPRVVVERGDFNDGDGCVDNASVVSKGGGFASNFFNLPNSISMARALSGPLIAWMITNQWYLSSCVGLAISGATDWLDGYMARKMRINSVIGSYLDPLADKILIGSVALAMVHANLLHPGLVGIVLLRDACLIAGGFYTRGSSLGWQWKSWSDYFNIDENSTRKVEPLFISKVNTVLQLALVAGALLQPEWGTEESQSYITYLSWLVASTTIVSSAAYIKQQSWKRSISMTKNC